MLRKLMFAIFSFAILFLAVVIGLHISSLIQAHRKEVFETAAAAAWAMPPDMNADCAQSLKVFGPSAYFESDVLRGFHGRYFNYADGVRSTSWQPRHYAATVWIFGPSTLLQETTPDDLTITSQLQRLLNVAGITYRVVNEGLTALSAGQEFDRLTRVSVQRGDLIVFYDGGVDAGANVSAWYLGWLQKAQQYAKSHGATFYAVLQPQIYSRPLTDLEQQLMDNLYPDAYVENARNMRADWPQMQAANRAIGGLDLTHVLDSLRDTEPVYLDYLHPGPQASPIIAHAIFDWITVF